MSDKNILDVPDEATDGPLIFDAKVSIAQHGSDVVTTLLRNQDGKKIVITLPMEDFKKAIAEPPPSEPSPGPEAHWYQFSYKKDGASVYSVFVCDAKSYEAAEEKFAKEVGEDVVIEKSSRHTLEPYSRWLPKRPDARYPRHAVTLLSATADKVEFAPLGGGMGHSGPRSQFLDEFVPVTEAMVSSVKPELAFFCFDNGPVALGFSYGNRWNGWGEPHIEESVMRRFVAKLKEDECEDEYTMFTFTDDGQLRYNYYDAEDDEDDYEIVEPDLIDYDGKIYRTYAVGLGLCWVQYDLPDLVHVADEERDELLEAFAPEGIDVESLLQLQGEEE